MHNLDLDADSKQIPTPNMNYNNKYNMDMKEKKRSINNSLKSNNYKNNLNNSPNKIINKKIHDSVNSYINHNVINKKSGDIISMHALKKVNKNNEDHNKNEYSHLIDSESRIFSDENSNVNRTKEIKQIAQSIKN